MCVITLNRETNWFLETENLPKICNFGAIYNCYYSHALLIFFLLLLLLLLIVNAFLFYFCTSKLICVRVNMVCVCHNSKMNWDKKQTNVCVFFFLSKRKKPRNKIYVYKNTVSHTHLLDHFGSFVFCFQCVVVSWRWISC